MILNSVERKTLNVDSLTNFVAYNNYLTRLDLLSCSNCDLLYVSLPYEALDALYLINLLKSLQAIYHGLRFSKKPEIKGYDVECSKWHCY